MPFDSPAPDAPPAIPLADVAAEVLWREAAAFDRDGADLAAMLRPLAPLALAALPAAYGGLDLAVRPEATATLAAVLRRVGGASAPAGRLFEGHVNAVRLAHRFAAQDVADDFFRDIAAGVWSGVWNAEAPPGLRLESDRLDGGKVYCSGAGFLQRPLVTARDEAGEVRMLALRGGGRGIVDLCRWTPAGMRATATGSVDLTGVEVAEDERVGGPGDYYRSPGFRAGAWRFLAVHLGAMERLEALMAEGLRRRGRDSDPHQRARFGRAAQAVETARLWVASAAARAEWPDGDPAAADAYVDLARGAVEEAALRLLELADRALGLESQLRPAPLERVARDLRTYLRQPFPDSALDAAAGWRLETRPELHP